MEKKMKRLTITTSEKVFTTLVVLLPILQMYSFPGTKILIIEVLFLFLCIKMLFSKKEEKIKFTVYFPLFVLLVYIIFHWLIISILNGSSYMIAITPRTIRNIFYLTISVFFIKAKFKINIALDILKFTAIFSTVYLIIQTILVNFFGYYLPGTLPFFETVVDEFNAQVIVSGSSIRPRSIFSEPAVYADFVGKYLFIDLFLNNKKKVIDFLPNLFVTLGLLLSGSSTGYLLLILVWTLFLTLKFSKRITLKKAFGLQIFILVIPITIILISNVEFLKTGYEHLIYNRSYQARLNNYLLAFNMPNISNFQVLFGNGFLPHDFFIPGIPRLYFYFGIFGIAIWSIVYLFMFRESKKVSRLLLFLMFLTSIFGDALFGISYLLFYPFIIGLNSYKRTELLKEK
jgi:hypothetical protein